MRPVELATSSAPDTSADLPRTVEVTTAHSPLAHAIAQYLSNRHITAYPVTSPTGRADCTIITEALTPANSVEQHYNALNAARLAKSSHLMLLLGADEKKDPLKTTGITGLARTLGDEWTDIDIRSVSLFADDPAKALDIIWRALNTLEARHLVSTPNGLAEQALGTELRPPGQRTMPLSTWLVTGGGRGVTAACTIELARRTGGTFLLAGRSPVIDWPNDIPLTKTLPDLIGQIARRRPGNTPAQLNHIGRSLLASQQVRETLQALHDAGARAHYVPLDISNGDRLAITLPNLQSQYGPITGLIHGAGVLADQRAENKTLADFETVFAPKVNGLQNLLTHLSPAELSHIALFSSAAALFGNAGQTAYAAANEVLNTLARRLARVHPQLHIRTFAWGPWEGGMVTPALAHRFKARGIPLIPEPEGARIFADQMLSTARDPVQICIGDRWTA